MSLELSTQCRQPLEVLALYPPHTPTMSGLLASRASVDPSRPFLLFHGRTTSYGEFQRQVYDAARMFIARGIAAGDRVAIMAPNSDSYVLMLFALARIGAILVPVNPEFGAAEAGYVLQHSGASAVACTSETLPTARAAAIEMQQQPWFFLLDDSADSFPSLDELIRTTPGGDLPENIGPEATCLILYTSGTTGFPKGVMHSQRSFVLAAEAFVERMHLQPDDRLFVVLPLFHINALFYSLGGALAAGASLLLAPRFSASTFWSVAAEGGATEVNIIAAVGNILTRRPRSEFVPEHQLRKVYGAGMSAETHCVFPREFGVPVLIEGYGLTEVPGVCNNPFLGPHKAGSIGRPAQHPDHRRLFAEMRVIGDEGNDLPSGQAGEIVVRTPIVMQGYYRDEEATANAFQGDWFRTGDVGYRDDDGFYYFVTRKKDIIRRRGENISGAEIDRVVASHPKVLEAATIAVPAELGEDEILVAIVPRPGQQLQADEIGAWCAQHLSAIKQPRYLVQVDSLPHTPTHRVAKFKLKEDASLRERAVELRAAK